MPLKISNTSNTRSYSDHYKASLYALWYNGGKPPAHRLLQMITELDPIKGCKPTTTILKRWIDNDWLPIADETDKKVSLELESRMIADKVEMLNRHAGVAREMQDKALEYLRENGVGTARNAIELLVKGLEIERNSVGAPVIAAKLSDLTDVQLLDELKLLVSSSKIDTIEPVIDIE